MKKKKNALLIILAAVVAMLVMSVNVWAAQKNPLAQMSTKASAVLYSAPAEMGCAENNKLNNTQSAQLLRRIFLYQDDFRYIQWRYLNFLTIPFSNLLANIITHIKFLFLSFYALFCKLTIP